jgi:hypothetical protein
MTVKSDHYLQKAAEFEALAFNAKDPVAKAAYADLARSYRQLASHTEGASFGQPTPPEKN